MEKEYEEIEFDCGCQIKDAVLELVRYAARGEFAKGSFNGHTLYSDTVSIDSAYKEICGDTYFNLLNKREISREKLRKEREEYEKTIPENTKTWIKKGRSVLDKKYWSKWEEIVPIRLGDLYEGMELKCCLDIVQPLNDGCSLDEAKDIIESQNHSGMSWGLVKSMVGAFCDRGNEFVEYLY